MNRRDFCGLSTWTLFNPAALGLLAWPRSAYSVVDPVSVALVVNTATSVIGLFSHGGSGIDDLLRLQAEMLAQISAELSAINNWMKQISERLDKIEQLIGQVPQQVVVELNSTNIAGAIAGFVELQAAYTALAKGPDGIQGARQQTQNKLNRRLDDLQTARLALMQPKYESVALIPTICSAAYAETQMMIMNYDSVELMLAAADTYVAWLKRLSKGASAESVGSKIKALSEQRAGYRKSEVFTPRDYSCNVRVYSTYKGWWVDVKRVACTPTISRDLKDVGLQDVAEEVKKMVDAGVLPKAEQPEKVVLTFTDIEATRRVSGQGSGGPDRAEQLTRRHCTNIAEQLQAEATRVSNGLIDSGVQLIALRALKKASDDGLIFLKNFSRGIREHKGN